MANSTRTRRTRALFDFSPLRDGLSYQGLPQALTPSGFITATYDRGGTVGSASSVAANGRVFIPGYKSPRLYHAYDSGTGLWTPRGVLLEGARTNPFTYSQNFENAAWGKVAVTSCLLDATGPDGIANSANTLIASGSTVQMAQISGTSLAAGQTAVVTCFFKVGTGAAFLVLGDIGDAVNHYAWFNLSTGVAGTQTNSTATTERLGNGWFRAVVKYTATNTYNQRCNIYLARLNSAFDAVATDNALLFGANGGVNIAFPSSYIPTTAAAVTRSADALSFPFNAVPQVTTMYAKITDTGAAQASGGRIVSISDTGLTVQFELLQNSSVFRARHLHTAAAVTSDAAATPATGDTVELRGILAADGSVQLGQSINAGTEAVAAASAAKALQSAWGSPPLINIGSQVGGTSQTFAAIHSVKIATGVKTLAQMRQI